MLYKKYHRNFISQFKEGVRFKYLLYSLTKVVDNEIKKVNGELCCESYYSESIVDKIAISFYGNIYVTNGYSSWDLVYSGGKINKTLYVIQEIS